MTCPCGTALFGRPRTCTAFIFTFVFAWDQSCFASNASQVNRALTRAIIFYEWVEPASCLGHLRDAIQLQPVMAHNCRKDLFTTDIVDSLAAAVAKEQ